MIPKFLIVDDDKDDQAFLSTAILEIVPAADVTVLDDGCEVINYLSSTSEKADPPHLVFMDLNMPKVCGRETTTLIRKDLRLKNLPIIILSTSSDVEEKRKVLELGANAFYCKPSSVGEIKQIVTKVINLFLDASIATEFKIA